MNPVPRQNLNQAQPTNYTDRNYGHSATSSTSSRMSLPSLSSCRLVFDAAGTSNTNQAVVWIPTRQSTGTAAAPSTEEPNEHDSHQSQSLLVYASHAMLHLATREPYTLPGRVPSEWLWNR